MTSIERFATAVLVVASTCCAAIGQGQTLTQAPTAVDPIRPRGILVLAPGAVEGLVLSATDTVFVQAGADTLTVWNGRKLGGKSGITLRVGGPIPDPDARPVFCVHDGEVCVVFVAKNPNGPQLAAGIVYHPKART